MCFFWNKYVQTKKTNRILVVLRFCKHNYIFTIFISVRPRVWTATSPVERAEFFYRNPGYLHNLLVYSKDLNRNYMEYLAKVVFRPAHYRTSPLDILYNLILGFSAYLKN